MADDHVLVLSWLKQGVTMCQDASPISSSQHSENFKTDNTECPCVSIIDTRVTCP